MIMDHIKGIEDRISALEKRLSNLESRVEAPERWLNFSESYKYLNIGRTTLWRWIQKGKIKAYKSSAGRAVRLKLKDLDAVMQPIEIRVDAEGVEEDED